MLLCPKSDLPEGFPPTVSPSHPAASRGNCGRCRPHALNPFTLNSVQGASWAFEVARTCGLYCFVGCEAGSWGLGGKEAAPQFFSSPLLSKYRLSELWDTPPTPGTGSGLRLPELCSRGS